jgi:hypothetical protein
MSVFSAPAKYGVVKIARSSSEAVLRTMKHTVIYPSSGPSLELTTKWFDIEDEHVLQGVSRVLEKFTW